MDKQIGEIIERYRIPFEESKSPYSSQFKNIVVKMRDLEVLVAEVAKLQQEKKRMDWLTKQVVEVRTPLRYGSRVTFIAVPEDLDGSDEPSDLRTRIDKNL